MEAGIFIPLFLVLTNGNPGNFAIYIYRAIFSCPRCSEHVRRSRQMLAVQVGKASCMISLS